jgi:hypothetical protein
LHVIDRALIAGIAVVAAAVLGCAGSPPVATSGDPSSSAIVTITVPPTEAATATIVATPPGAATAGPSAAASGDASDEPSASPDGSGPPKATLSVEGGDAVTGQLGTYTWGGAGSDSPWLRGAPLKAGPGEPLTMTLSDGVAAGQWTARRLPAGSEGAPGAISLGTGPGAPVTFPSPRKGTWSVQVTVEFGGGQGSASYYWRLDVK